MYLAAQRHGRTRSSQSKPPFGRYNTYRFGGRKHIILSTASWLGGRTDFLGVAYLTVGGGCLLFSVVVLALQLLFGRKLGDLDRLSWVQQPPTAAIPAATGAIAAFAG